MNLSLSLFVYSFKSPNAALDGVAQWIESGPADQGVAGSVPR